MNTIIFRKLQRFFHFYSQKLMNTLIFKGGDTPRHMCVNMSRKGSVGLFQMFFFKYFWNTVRERIACYNLIFLQIVKLKEKQGFILIF